MSDDLETTEDQPDGSVTREHVQARVDDWLKRLDELFGAVRRWAEANSWQVDSIGTIPMREELMEKFDIPPKEQPVLRLDNGPQYALFKPKGLWVIGANGRLDLFTSRGTFIIVDLAKFNDAPQWTIFRATDKRDGDPFTPETIADLV